MLGLLKKYKKERKELRKNVHHGDKKYDYLDDKAAAAHLVTRILMYITTIVFNIEGIEKKVKVAVENKVLSLYSVIVITDYFLSPLTQRTRIGSRTKMVTFELMASQGPSTLVGKTETR